LIHHGGFSLLSKASMAEAAARSTPSSRKPRRRPFVGKQGESGGPGNGDPRNRAHHVPITREPDRSPVMALCDPSEPRGAKYCLESPMNSYFRSRGVQVGFELTVSVRDSHRSAVYVCRSVGRLQYRLLFLQGRLWLLARGGLLHQVVGPGKVEKVDAKGDQPASPRGCAGTKESPSRGHR